jgi:hypothetical protein
VVSRDGWAVINDTSNPTLDGSDWWTGKLNRNDADLYLFAHGHDYKQAIADFTQVWRAVGAADPCRLLARSLWSHAT